MKMYIRLAAALLALGTVAGCGSAKEETFEISVEDQQAIQQQRDMEAELLRQQRQRTQQLPAAPGAAPAQPAN